MSELPARGSEPIPRPPCRRLSVYAFDPALDVENRTAAFAREIVKIPWEADYEAKLATGPVNEYLEVVDVDPSSGKFYEPVDLDAKWLLAQDGHRPSEGNPQFHQQMAFAVAMKTIGAFEAALGRKVLWSSRHGKDEFIPRLRIYPHAFRGENAYYSPSKKAVLLGYFQANDHDLRSVPGGWVFGALSHDVIAHECTHAILDGVNPRFIEDSNVDALAFHEGFSDIVALLQHFTFKSAVRGVLAAHEGDLNVSTLLSSIADQFGRARLKQALADGPLRDAVVQGGSLDPYTEAHARGARLLAAVYSAFAELYSAAVERIRAIARPDAFAAPMHPTLVDKLAETAAKIAQRLLGICIRALDLLPPASVTFTDFLRAIVTTDAQLFPGDEAGYRRALIAAFRRYGAVRAGVRSLAEESLVWPTFAGLASDASVRGADPELDTEPLYKRSEIHAQALKNARVFHAWIAGQPDFCAALGLFVDPAETPATVARDRRGKPAIQVHSLRSSRRATAGGSSLRQLVVGLSQRRFGFFDPDEQARRDAPGSAPCTEGDFLLRGGVTIMFDLGGKRERSLLERATYVVRQPIGEATLAAARDYRVDRASGSLGMTYAGDEGLEPLGMLHAARRL